MKVVWVDTNILLRFLTGKPRDQWRRATALLQRAADKQVVLHVPVVVIAEVVAILHHSLDVALDEVARTLTGLLSAEGLEAEDDAAVVEALHLTELLKVDFVDAYVAVKVRDAGEQIASFDVEFSRKLGATPFAL